MEDTEDTIDTSDVERIKAIKLFLGMFEYRDKMYSKLTEKIFTTIDANVLAAFNDLFQLPTDNLTWMDTQVDMEDDHNALLLTFSITYNREQANAFIRSNFGFDDTEETNVRVIKFGIPLYFVFAPKDEVIKFIVDATDSDITELDISDSSLDDAFDTSKLQPHQLEQLKLFNKKGNVH